LFAAAAHGALVAHALAQETTPVVAPEAPHGIVPLEDYKGDLWTRPRLTGDWGGTRTKLAAKGLTLGIDWTQVVQGVAEGGRNTTFKYGGGLDYNLKFDLDRANLIRGGLVTFRAESRYGESVNGDAGPISPVNLDHLFPLTDELDEGIPFTITTLNYTQFLSPHFALVAGKFDTLDGDTNEFASGRGVSQFMNANFVANGVFAAGLPYSTLGVSALWIANPHVDVAVTIANSSDSSTTSGFSDFGDGYLIASEAHFKYDLGVLPGGMAVGGFYVGDSNFAHLGSRLSFEPGTGLVVPTDDSTWCLYWNGWQYLTVEDPGEAPIDLANGKPDRKGIGLFARAGIADKDTDPVDWSLSGGLGGRGGFGGRDNDVFGVGYFYNHVVTGRLTGLLGLDDHNQGIEAFYNIALTPAAHLTLDIQYVEAALPSVDPALVVGGRLSLNF
jgi:porin